MNVSVREARAADAEAIRRLNRDELGYDYPLRETAGKLEKLLFNRSCRIFVAECGGAVVGYVHAADYDLLYAPHLKTFSASPSRRISGGTA